MKLLSDEPLPAPFPPGLRRWTYSSAIDGLADRALVLPGTVPIWFVMVHGHGSHEDQLYTRPDLRDAWLEALRRTGGGLLTPNLRDNAWMSPAAEADLHGLLQAVREAYGVRHFIFFSGSMGGSSNLFYALRHPEDAAALAALGAAPDPAPYVVWCRAFPEGSIQRQIGAAIESAYGGPPESHPEPYAERDAIARAARLTMPVYLSHGANDALMPAAEARRLARALQGKTDFSYTEIPEGDHDSPIFRPEPLAWVTAVFEGLRRTAPLPSSRA
jgi:pimeloyl-ACP methyl ester carboxylesterase